MNWIQTNFDFKPKRPLFLCIISNTDTGKIPGLSAAGTSPELTDYTPGADAELVETNRIITMPELPEAPGGSPTPAIVTKAALNLTGIPSLFVASGLRKKPAVPFVELGGTAGKDITKETAVPDAIRIYENAVLLGKKLSQLSDCVFIGESIAGGTTTALAVLKAIGIDANVSSSFQTNPMELKTKVVKDALFRAGIREGDCKSNPMRAVTEVGDPMMPAALGLLKGLKGTKVVLAGGTQMAAVLSLARLLEIEGDIAIATTKYIVEDRTANFCEIVEATGWPYYYSDPGLENSKIPPVQIYAKGYVKEGVGMGGATLLAFINGIDQRRLVEETDRVLMTVELPHK